MRGRRRGRTRPSPPGAPSASADASSGPGAVKVLDSEDPEVPEASSDGSVTADAAEASVPETSVVNEAVSGETSDATPSPTAPEKSGSPVTAESPGDGKGQAPGKSTSVSQVSDATTTAPADEATKSSKEAVADEPESAAPKVTEAEATPAPVGRQPQAASGNPLPRIMAVANQKGGVGKTTTSVNLGAALAELGFRVLVIDLDPQGNATTGLGVDARNFEFSMYDVLMRDTSLEDCVEPTSMKNLFVAPATIALAGAEIELVPAFSRELKLKRAIESVIDDFDYVLIDCPPSLGLITVNALAAADEVLVPIQCEYYALEGLSQLMRNVHLVASNLNPRLDISTIVLTMYDARTKLADQVATEVREHFGNKVCRIVIPRTVRLSEAPSFGQPITAFDPASRGAIAYRELAKEVSGGTS
jgi:chromosome partitioning protein